MNSDCFEPQCLAEAESRAHQSPLFPQRHPLGAQPGVKECCSAPHQSYVGPITFLLSALRSRWRGHHNCGGCLAEDVYLKHLDIPFSTALPKGETCNGQAKRCKLVALEHKHTTPEWPELWVVGGGVGGHRCCLPTNFHYNSLVQTSEVTAAHIPISADTHAGTGHAYNVRALGRHKAVHFTFVLGGVTMSH